MDVVEQIRAILDRATQDFDGRDEIMQRAADEIERLRTAPTVAAQQCDVTPDEVGGLVERLLRADLDAVQQATPLIQSQAARIASLEAALKPFALAAAVYDYDPPIYSDDDKSDSSLERSPLRVGDFRLAFALLNGERKG